ncbi:hypothetical protein CLCR_09067 [Cladophialophora carrionii]|uniref:4a-hydroxytetrahydrobiopterin dehydratase n=1 Tax=Cladophialophora carrionii TaxID=86049 RepID=A0A1C1CRZ8_9EURO|nr:hypothetical protein CLCR_09067 [Cladophialophora carrionii]
MARFISAQEPIPPDRQTINIGLQDGTVITQKFSPTPKASLDRLGKALSELLQTPEQNTVIEAPNEKAKDTAGISFGTVEWYLDPEGDAIHRHTAHPSATELNIIEELIMRRADEMGHHPHISRGKVEEGADMYMTITCTTHSPRGLSVRDMKLARKINEILAEFNTVTPWKLNSSRDMDDEKPRIAALRERMIAANRAKINEALERCGCEAAKSRSTNPPGVSAKGPV